MTSPSASKPIPGKPASVKLGSHAVTQGIRVDVTPGYLPHDSDPEGHAGKPRWVFTYRVRITNEGQSQAKLVSRHWTIIDSDGDRHEVHGEGVIGHQPDLSPGEHFEYSSYCPLETPWGTMEGSYTFEAADGSRFEVAIARFYLVSPTTATSE
jgi:ApaG protein